MVRQIPPGQRQITLAYAVEQADRPLSSGSFRLRKLFPDACTSGTLGCVKSQSHPRTAGMHLRARLEVLGPIQPVPAAVALSEMYTAEPTIGIALLGRWLEVVPVQSRFCEHWLIASSPASDSQNGSNRTDCRDRTRPIADSRRTPACLGQQAICEHRKECSDSSWSRSSCRKRSRRR